VLVKCGVLVLVSYIGGTGGWALRFEGAGLCAQGIGKVKCEKEVVVVVVVVLLLLLLLLLLLHTFQCSAVHMRLYQDRPVAVSTVCVCVCVCEHSIYHHKPPKQAQGL
jgi:hypothetical protein